MMSMEVPTYLDTGSPHNSTPTSPSFAVSSRQAHLRPPSRPSTPVSVQSTSLEPPSGLSYLDFVRTWNDTHVARWLSDCKCGHHATTFANNDIRGDILLDLDQATLREMGIASVGDRIKILNGVKLLRGKCSKGSKRNSILPQQNQNLPVKLHGDAGTQEQRSRHARPPPLHLSQSATPSNLPQLIRNDSGSNVGGGYARNGPGPRPLPPPGPGGGHTHSHSTSSTKDVNGVTRGLPPLPPPPRVQPPAAPGPARSNSNQNLSNNRGLHPPANQPSGRRTPTADPPAFTNSPLPPAPGPGSVTPSGNGSWTGSYGLPPRPNLGDRTPNSAIPGRSTSPLPPQRPPRPPGGLSGSTIHSRTGSVSNSGMHHPFAAAPDAQGQGTLQPPGVNVLSPIQENFMNQRGTGNSTPSPPTAGSSASGSLSYTSREQQQQLRPNTPSAARRQMSAEDIRRRCVRFILADDGHRRLIDVEDIPRGTEILEVVLKKFGKSGGIGFPSVEEPEFDSTDPDEGLVVDGWGIFLDHPTESQGKHLSETELLLICHDEHNPAREHGLTLRRVTKKRSKALKNYFGEAPPPHAGSPSPPSPETPTTGQLNPRTGASKHTKRASTISILSGLGVPDPERVLAPPNYESKPSSPTPSLKGKAQNKVRNFSGQRPPSELITNHLQEYFPYTEKKALARTHRQSMMFKNRPDSIRSGVEGRRFSRQSWMPPNDGRNSFSSPPLPPVPLFQDSQSIRSSRSIQSGKSFLSTLSAASSNDPPPRMSVSTEDGRSIDITDEPDADRRRMSTQPQYLPPVEFPSSETLSETIGRRLERTASNASSSRNSRRTSYLMDLRSKRDRSDTASLLTVDEITQEVESRRASMIADGKDPENLEEEEEESTAIESATEVEDDGEDEDEEATMNNDNDADDEDEGKKVTPVADKKSKWHKGALIGAGSFGSVYLAMDAFTGLLMAVKQVELPTGSAPNEERKKSMLHALEREIELLKELQHENIVQYLDSYSDGVHLNIFLEYVPGGSVATLLRNYGAFEEALVRNFVRQILQGLDYLHEREIIHRDIKGANILVDNKGGVKISDFGISKKVEDTMMTGARLHRPSLQGSVFWMAPEVVKQTSYTLKADIWSLGCLVVEMLTGEHPWAQLTQMQAIFKIGSQGARPTFPSDISSDAEDFLSKTFEFDHTIRPSAAQLLEHPWIKDPTKKF